MKNWTIAFDADDTLWENLQFFSDAELHFTELLSDYADPKDLHNRLFAAETQNLATYGYGIKGFTLSMIETALDVTDGRVPTEVISKILLFGKEMLHHPIELLPDVEETIKTVSHFAEILMITKGDLHHQERKLAQSGLGDLFDRVEIVSEKTTETYSHIFARHDTAHQMMVGNSMKSDILPALDAGAWGVYVPHKITWEFEEAEPPITHRHFRQIKSLKELPGLIAELA